MLESTDLYRLQLTVGQEKLLHQALSHLQGITRASCTQTSVTTANLQPVQSTQDNQTPGSQQTIPSAGEQEQVTPQATTEPPSVIQPLQLAEAGKTFDELFHNLNKASISTPAASTDKYQTNFDPRAMLTVRTSGPEKALHITQFLTEKTKRRRQTRSRRDLVLGTTDWSDQLIFRTEESHPYSGITVGEWGAANTRLLNALLKLGKLARHDLEFYLSYTAHIMDALDIYEWDSILEYDHQYRELQAEHQFMWGTPATHLENKILIPRSRKFEGKPSTTRRPKQGPKPQPQGVEPQDCWKFLAKGECPFGNNCRYRHPQLSSTGTRAPPMPKN